MLDVAPYSWIEKLMKISIDKMQEEKDCVFLVLGHEGQGKSTLSLDLIDIYERIKNTRVSIDMVCFDLPELAKGLSKAKKGDIILLDEGSELSSMNTNKKDVVNITRAYTVMRKKCMLSIICFTNPSKLITYFRNDRVKGVFFIKRRGIVYFYERKRFNWIMEELMTKKHKSIERFSKYNPTFRAEFPKYTGHLLEEYNVKKDKGIDSVLDDLSSNLDGLASGERNISSIKVNKILNINNEALSRLIDKGLLHPVFNPFGARYFNPAEVQALVSKGFFVHEENKLKASNHIKRVNNKRNRGSSSPDI